MNSSLKRGGAQVCLVANLLLMLFRAEAGPAFPLTWRWSNPLPHGNNIIDMAQAGSFWIQVAEQGQIYTSGDLALWTPRDSHTSRALRAVTFFNDRIIATGEAGTVVTGTSALELQHIDLSTGDWLEGVAASSSLAVAVGDNGAVYTSTDGIQWQRAEPPFTEWLRSVAHGTPGGGGMFVAVGEGGFVAHSVDGVKWEAQKRLTTADLNRVSWSNGEFWIVGDSGAAFNSTTGTSWIPVDTGATNTLNAFAGVDSARLIAGEDEVRLRQGRSDWKDELSPDNPYPPPIWTYLSATADTNSLVLAGRTGLIEEGLISTNGVAVWFSLDDSLRNWLWDLKRFPDLYLAVGDRATILSSVDGIGWTPELPPDTSTNSIFLGIGGKTNHAVVVGNAGSIISSIGTIQTVVSTNQDGTLRTNTVNSLGIYWQAVIPRPTTNDLQGITVFGGLFVASGGSGTILTSTDAVSWTRQGTPTSSFLSSVETFPGGLVAVGRSGTILTSPDGIDWTSRASPTSEWIYRVRFAGGRLIAVGQNGTILTSQDGSEWTRQNSGTSSWLNDVHWMGDSYFAVGNQGTVLTSPDASTWTDRGTITGKSLFAAGSHEGMLVVAGVEGVILRTQVASFDTPVGFLQFNKTSGENVFLFSGQAGQRFTLDRSTNLPAWTPGPILEIDNSGTLLHVDSGLETPPQQFFRTKTVP